MVESVLGFLALLVFALLWLASQDWFDLLPPRVIRGVSGVAAVVLAVTCYAAPSAFQAGFRRFTDYLATQTVERIRGVLANSFDPPTAKPTPAIRSEPTVRRQ